MDDLVKRLRRMDGDSMSIKTLDEAADRIEALERQVKAADALAERLQEAVDELRYLIPGYAGAAVADSQVEEDVSQYVSSLAAYRATKEGGV